jgi:pentatricopeptide repeat protein
MPWCDGLHAMGKNFCAAAMSMTDQFGRCRTYASVISACERSGRFEQALELLEEMQAAGIQPNGYIFTALINACEQVGEWEKAIELFKLMTVRLALAAAMKTLFRCCIRSHACQCSARVHVDRHARLG